MDKQDEKNQLAPQGVPVMLVAQPIEQDEINLFDLWYTLCKRKGLIAAITCAATLVGVAYALLATPIYHVEARFSQPTKQDIAPLISPQTNSGIRLAFGPQTAQEVFARFTESLNDFMLRRDFFSRHQQQLAPNTHSDTEQKSAFDAFDAALQTSVDSNQTEGMALSWEGSNPKQIAEWLNAFSAMAMTHAKARIISDITTDIERLKISIKREIDSKLSISGLRRQDRITRLEEALQIAVKLGIENYRMPITNSGKKSSLSITMSDQPLYLMGSRVLNAELSSLKTRKDDTAFVSGLRNLQEQLAQLDSIHIDPKNIRVAHIDQPAVIPQHRIKPKRKVIVLGALLSGLVLGVIIALMADAVISNRRKYISG